MWASKRIETERKRGGRTIQTWREKTNPKFRGENLKWAGRYRHFPWKRVGKFLNDVCRFVRAFLSISLFSLSPLFLRANRRGAQSSSCKFSKGGERRKEGRVKRREDDREGGIHPDYANKRNGFHIWSFNEAKTIAEEEEEEEKRKT